MIYRSLFKRVVGRLEEELLSGVFGIFGLLSDDARLLKVYHAVSLYFSFHLANELFQVKQSQQAMLVSGELFQVLGS